MGWADVATKRDLDVFATELRSEMAVMRAELRTEISELRGDLKSQTTRLLLWLIPTVIAGMGLAARAG